MSKGSKEIRRVITRQARTRGAGGCGGGGGEGSSGDAGELLYHGTEVGGVSGEDGGRSTA